MPDWETIIAAVGSGLAVVALVHTSRANKEAREANRHSRKANTLDGQANEHAARAIKIQEEQSRLRLRVEPSVRMVGVEGLYYWPKLEVRIVNLSAFPVTIDDIRWEADSKPDGELRWRFLSESDPSRGVPAQIAPRESQTFHSTEPGFAALSDLEFVTAAVVYTTCGARVTGTTDEWAAQASNVVAECAAKGEMGGGGNIS